MSAKASKAPRDRSELQQILANLIQGVLVAELDGSIAWANDAALEMHGCAELAQLGAGKVGYRKQFALRYLNNHRLTAKQYPLDRLVAGERFDNVKVEVTHRSQNEFRRVLELRGFPVVSSLKIIESLVLIVSDVTELESAADRFERAFAANPAPAVILRLADSRYVRVNRGFLEMTGFTQEAVIDRPFHELDVLREAEHREAALESMREHRSIPQQEALARVSDGTDKFVIVAAQPIEMDKEACMLFTFADLDARKRAEMSLLRSEEQFAKAFRSAPVPMLICARPDWRIMAANDAFGDATGYHHPDIQGQTLRETGLWKSARILDDLRVGLDAGQETRNLEVPLVTRDGAAIDCLLSAQPVTIQDEACVLCVVQDVTERKRAEADVILAIETVMKDTTWFSHTVMEKLAQIRQPGGASSELAALTPRELEILGLICKGHDDAEIANALNLSRHTIRNHVANLYSKIGVKRRGAAVVWGRERGVASY
ncbi:helix-turn-helix transcriptional regulator [Rhodanobacter sp. 7MK24]|uniref:helix-turn-helix transcriptional regulator n=1 Tax=Rhodanobacter sp. 7MK24 TaxID=2775922 RepID=UPI00178238B6|nr:helix-turn-helix transcriptional regulator [Rhodanobacter sp. 7MK24]MBD8880262.1 helix-turn-helix transcriptional regulator [Rhodanobacter sp. 7MK24]